MPQILPDNTKCGYTKWQYSFLEKSSKELEEKNLSPMQTKRTLQKSWETRIFDIICLLLTFCRNILRE